MTYDFLGVHPLEVRKETYFRAFDSETKALKPASNQLVGCIPQVCDDCISKFQESFAGGLRLGLGYSL